MKRDSRLVKLSWDHHHGLVMALRIERDLASGADLAALYRDLLVFWFAGLLPHFRTENECLLARLIHHLPLEHEVVRQTQAEHLDLEGLVALMRDTAEVEARRQALARFGAQLKAHIRWEEATLFALTEQTLTEHEMDALGADIADRLPDVVAAGDLPPRPRSD